MAYSDEQYNAAGQWIAANINDPGAVRAAQAQFGLSNDDMLRAAQTQNAGITMGNVQSYLAPQAQAASGPKLNTGYTPSPYLDQQAQGIMQLQNRNLQEQILPGVRSNAIAAGGFGDARHGVAEGLAMGRTNDAIAREVTNLYGTDYQKSQDRNMQQYIAEMGNQLGYAGLDTQRYGIDTGAATARYGTDTNNATQRYGIDQNYSLGQTNAANNRYGTDKQYEVGMAGANASMANAAANQAQAAGNLALGQQQMGVNTMFGLLDRQNAYNNNGIAMGTNIQNTPAGYYDRFNQQANSMGQGFSTQTQTQQGGGTDPLMGAAGIARIGQSWYNSSQPVASNNNVYFGTGSMGD